MPEGDSVHRVARRLSAALAGRELERAQAPSPRSPLHGRAEALLGRRLDHAEARGKHLLAHFSGRWRFFADRGSPYGRPWLLLAAGSVTATQTEGKLLRLVSESRLGADPVLRRLGPDPLSEGFDRAEATRRMRELGAGREVGEALLDQRIVAGVGNAPAGRGRADDACLARPRPAPAGDLPRDEDRLPGVRWASQLAGSGRREPNRLLVRALSDLIVPPGLAASGDTLNGCDQGPQS